jgi:hypothetical protein
MLFESIFGCSACLEGVAEESAAAEFHPHQYGVNILSYFVATDNLGKLQEIAQPRVLIADHAGNSPLHYAAESGSYRVSEYIVSLFPEIPIYNQSNFTPSHFAPELVIVDIGGSIQITPSHRKHVASLFSQIDSRVF